MAKPVIFLSHSAKEASALAPRTAALQGKVVIPIAATGGDARYLYRELALSLPEVLVDANLARSQPEIVAQVALRYLDQRLRHTSSSA